MRRAFVVGIAGNHNESNALHPKGIIMLGYGNYAELNKMLDECIKASEGLNLDELSPWQTVRDTRDLLIALRAALKVVAAARQAPLHTSALTLALEESDRLG